MADEQDKQVKLDTIRNHLESITSIDIEQDLVRAEDLGQANFRPGVPVFKRTIDLFSQLKASDLTVFPPNILDAILERTERAASQFAELADFSLAGQPDPVAARDQLVAALESAYNEHFQKLEPHINYLLVKQTDFAALEAQAREAMEKLAEFTHQMQGEQEAIRHDMQETLRSVKEDAAEAGVGQQSLVFSQQAETNDGQAKKWLIATSGFGALALVYAVLAFLIFPVPTETTAEVVRESVARLVVLTLLLFGLGFAGRQYVSARHNETVNRHRQNALRTFETFVRATADPETKDAVLLEATRSIFSSQPTGFLRHDGDRDSPSTVIEVVRRVAGSSDTS